MTATRGSERGGPKPPAMAEHKTTSTFHFKWDSYEGFQTLRDLVRTRMQREPDLDYGIFFLYNLVRCGNYKTKPGQRKKADITKCHP